MGKTSRRSAGHQETSSHGRTRHYRRACAGDHRLSGQADIWVGGKLAGWADVPAGRSTGANEAHELCDGGNRYRGLGVRKAVAHVNGEIRDALVGLAADDQRALDRALVELDGTANKSRLGANALLGVSLAAARAAAVGLALPLYRYLNATARVLPVPLMNCLNGGRLTANALEIQEFIIMPVDADDYGHALEITPEINEVLRDLVIEKYGLLATNTGDEGGFATPMTGIWEPLEYMARAVDRAGYEGQVVYALDCAANSWFDEARGLYTLDGTDYYRDALIGLYGEVAAKYPLASMEDPPAEEDFEGFVQVTRALPETQIVGDDLFVTNKDWLRRGIAMGRLTPCCSRSTRSAPCRRRWRRPKSPSAPATAFRSRSVPARRRTRSSPTWSSPSTVDRSRPACRSGASARASTTACCRARRSSAPALSMPGGNSAGRSEAMMLSSEVGAAFSDHGERVLRRAALDIAGHALAAADPGRAARALLSFDGDALSIGDERPALDAETRIFVVGAGKATFPIAAVLDEVLGPRIHAGLVVGKRGERAALTHIETRLAAHPVPDDASLAAARDTRTLRSTARPGDLVIACFTGGSSALFSELAGGLDVADKRRLNELLLASGADIRAINAVRKHAAILILGLRFIPLAPVMEYLVFRVQADV